MWLDFSVKMETGVTNMVWLLASSNHITGRTITKCSVQLSRSEKQLTKSQLQQTFFIYYLRSSERKLFLKADLNISFHVCDMIKKNIVQLYVETKAKFCQLASFLDAPPQCQVLIWLWISIRVY